MTDGVCGGVVASIKLRANDSAKVTDRDLHTTRGCSLSRTRDVYRRPTQCKCGCWIDARGAEEYAEIADSWMVVMWSMYSFPFDVSCNNVIFVVGKKDNVPYNGEGTGCLCKWCPDLGTCGKPSDADSDDCRNGVGRDS